MLPNEVFCGLGGEKTADGLLIPLFTGPGVISELEIYRAANVLVRTYGDQAQEEARSRVEDFLRDGDLEGQAVWVRIGQAVEALQLKEAPPGEREH